MEFVKFKIRDMDTDTLLFEIEKPESRGEIMKGRKEGKEERKEGCDG